MDLSEIYIFIMENFPLNYLYSSLWHHRFIEAMNIVSKIFQSLMRFHIRKDPDTGKGKRQAEKGTTEDEMIRWHHWLNGHDFEQMLGDSERQVKPGMLQFMG